MLNYKVLKLIKPTDSVDDYESGVSGEFTPKNRSEMAVNAIRKALTENGAMFIKEIIKVTGTSQGGTHGIITRFLKNGLVTCIKGEGKTGTKPIGYFSLVAS